MRYGEHKREIYGSSPHTTNNRMELAAAIEGLKRLKERCAVEVITDSEYVKNGITRWVAGWKRNDWRKPDKQPVLNRDLWMELDKLAGAHATEWKWTKGHATHADNNRCDELASHAASEQIASEPQTGLDPYALHAATRA